MPNSSIVEGLFGLTPLDIHRQQQEQINSAALQYAKLDPLQRAAMGMYQGGAGLANIGAGMLGMENPAIAEARAREAAIGGLDFSNPEAILQRAQQIGDPRLKLRLTQYAQQLKAQQQAALLAAQKDARQQSHEQYLQNAAHELKVMQLEAAKERDRAASEDRRLSIEQREAASRRADATDRLIAQMQADLKKAAIEAKMAGKSSLSATAQKELFEADEAVMGAKAGSKALDEALAINNKAMGFKGAGLVADVGSILPDFVRPKIFDATLDLDNIVQQSVLPQLKSIFGANPTEGERKILLEVAGSSSKPPSVRKGIFERAKRAAEARAKFNEDKANKLRSGTYFNGAQLEETTVPEISGQTVTGTWSIRKK